MIVGRTDGSAIAPWLLGLAVLAGGCGTDPQVEVSTYVGPTHARHDAERSAEHAREVLAAKFSGLLDKNTVEKDENKTPRKAPVVHPPEDAEQLQDLITALRRAPLTEIDGPARRLAHTGPQLWPEVRALLAAERPATKGDYKSTLRAIAADMPNRYGHFALQWKRDHGFKVKRSDDWLEDLLSLPTSKVSSRLRKVYRDTVLVAALMHAASTAGRTSTHAPSVIHTLLDLAWQQDGIWRDEVSRRIEAIGDEAVAPLIAASVVPPYTKRTEFDVAVRRPMYATAMLDRMDRLVAERAIESVAVDPERLSRVLAAYGVTRRADAAQVVLEHVDHDIVAVRAAARIAWLGYVAGPLPKARSREIKLLGGGTGRAQAYLSYRARAEVALREKLQHVAPHLLEAEPECELRRENGSIDPACERQPMRLTDAWFSHLDETRRQAGRRELDEALATADPEEATARLDRLVTRGDPIERIEDVIAFVANVGRKRLDDDDPKRGAQLLRKAAVLADTHDPVLARGLRVDALLAEASVDGLEPSGRQMLLHSAQSLAPEDARIDVALAQRRTDEASTGDEARLPVLHVAGGVGLLAVAFGCLSILGHGLRRRL